ncbi:MAG: NAD-dependent epimerase/dehydratase family protein [Gemmatimonadetes bacterium]|nr:NAD-dependent epimerase/dehydratase family protein [Gemmatimonadota bacterium]
MATRRALVTGAGGFVGQWLVRELVRHGWEVTGSSLVGVPPHGVLSPEDHGLVQWRRDDLLHASAVRDAVDAAQPDAVFHLAAVSFVPAAGKDPALALDTNVGIAVRLLDVLEERKLAGTLDPTVVVIGSGEQYGRHDATAQPLREGAECRPLTAYAASKLAQEAFALASFRRSGLRVICTRSFNHSGRGQTPDFVLPALARRIREAVRSGAASIPVGNLHVSRDFLHVEDVVRAYALLAEDGLSGEVYNVASGRAVQIGELAAAVIRAAGATLSLVTDPGLQRGVDIPHLAGDAGKLREDTGWMPRLGLDDIVRDVLADCPS